MSKSFKSILLLVVALMLTLTLTGCGFASKAQKIEEDFKDGEEMSLKDIKDKMGDPTSEVLVMNSGAVIWIEGCDTLEEAQKKWDDGKTMDALVITVVANNVTAVKYIAKASEKDVK